MKMGTTGSGKTIVMINDNVYMSFGKEKSVKWIHLSFPVEKGGARGGEMFKPDMTGLSTEGKKVLGKDNIKVIKSVFKDFMKDGMLDSKDLLNIGAKLELVGL